MASRLICCFVVTVLCCQVLHNWILVMDPKCLALHAISHIRSVESRSLARATVEVLDFIERDISGMSTTSTEEMKHGKPSVRRYRRRKWLLSRIILPTLILRSVLSQRNREDELLQNYLWMQFGVLGSTKMTFSEWDISWSGGFDLITDVVNGLKH